MNRLAASSADRLFGLALGYIGVTTFVLVVFVCTHALDLTPGDSFPDHLVAVPMWEWLLATTLAAGAVVVIEPARRAATAGSRRAR
ncbi:hypothetical protein [Williamsia sp. M5A3_1d]